MRGILTFFLTCFVAFGMVACGGGSSKSTTPIVSAIAITPTSATVPIGGSQTFTANVTAGTVVTWSLSGPGSINANGTYVAPSTFPSPNNITITATASGQTGTASGSVVYPLDNTANQSTPIKLGTSGGNVLDNSSDGKSCCIGTLGSLISIGANNFILSNNHVLARSSKGVAGESIDQPGQAGCPAGSQGEPVATLSQQAALKPTTVITTGACAGQPAPCGNSPSNVDAALAAIDTAPSSAVDTTGTILDLGAAGPSSIAPAQPNTTPIDANIAFTSHNRVAKSGRTTGLTCSTIQSVNTDGVAIQYENFCGDIAAGKPAAFTAVYNGQIVIAGGNFSAGGDSGSLIVTADTAQPVGLLYGGSTANTVANTILDSKDHNGVATFGVLTAFNSGTAPTFVGSASTHAVSCVPTAVAQSVATAAQSTPVSESRMQIATAVRNRQATNLMAAEPAIKSVKVAASLDSPGDAVLQITLTSAPKTRIPPAIEGVRTQVIYAEGVSAPVFTSQEFDRGLVAKDNHRTEYFGIGFQGIGVGRSDDAPGESAIVIFTVKGVNHAAVPAVIDGVRTKVLEDEQFRSSHWNPQLEPKSGGACGKSQAAPATVSTQLIKK